MTAAHIFIGSMRYRLWDVDMLINRAPVYGALPAVLALVSFGSIVLLQPIVRGLTGLTSSRAAIASIEATTALFEPVRRHIQAIIDRRCYRRRDDAVRTRAACSAQLRDAVDLQRVTDDRLAVVPQRMQPIHVSLWLGALPPRTGSAQAIGHLRP